MLEFSVDFYNEENANMFKESIDKTVKSFNGIVTIFKTNNFFKILIAVYDYYKKEIIKTIKTKIAENILLYYKKDYIISRLNFNKNSNIKMQVFLKALVCFDSEIDKEIILNRLENINKNIVVESFINFKVNFLKRKWNELIDLANDNAIYLTSEDTFNELIKFLISNLENRIGAVNIFNKNNCYFLCDVNGSVIDDFLCENSGRYDDEKLLTNLIALNPEKIIIHEKNLVEDKLLNNLYEYFSSRIEICK